MAKRPAAPIAPAVGPDFAKAEFTGERVSIYDLHRAALRRGEEEVKGLRFTRCLIEGPAVLLLARGVEFGDCDLGDAAGELDTLLLKPVSRDRVTGVVPVVDCVFESCRFQRIGFTGSDATLDMLRQITEVGDAPTGGR